MTSVGDFTDPHRITLSFGCDVCGNHIDNESGFCRHCGDYGVNVWTDDAGNLYSEKEAERLLESEEAIRVYV